MLVNYYYGNIKCELRISSVITNYFYSIKHLLN